MEYVMVPVPEEHVVDVMQHVARLVARASVEPWTSEDLSEYFEQMDEASRSVLSLVARTTLAAKDLSDEDAADALELSVRELRTIIRDANEDAQRMKHQPLLVLRDALVTLRNGRSVQKRLFAMDEAVARMVRSHERTSLIDEDVAVDEAPS